MKKEVYIIEGMSCAACSSAVERVTRKLEGVAGSSVNLTTGKLTIEYDEQLLKPETIVAKIERAGFHAVPFNNKASSGPIVQSVGRVGRGEPVSLIAAGVLSALLLYVAMGPMLIEGLPLPAFMSMTEQPVNYALTQLLLCIPVLFIGRRFFVSGIPALFRLRPNMDSLVALGSGFSFIYSVVMLYGISQNPMHAHHLYFESAAVVTTLVLLGKHMESSSKKKTTGAIQRLMELAPDTAVLLDDYGGSREVEAASLKVGDRVLIRPQSRIPADGEVIGGLGEVDESMLTGESMPVEKSVGSTVTGGSRNASGVLTVRVTRVGEDSTLSKIVAFVEDAQGKKAPISKLADKVAGVFVPIVMAVALLSAVIWLLAGYEFSFGLRVFTSVLVIACPCAMGLATPTAVVVGTGVGAGRGILIRSGEALELLHRTNVVLLDKTGTVTEGRPRLCAVVGHEASEDELLSMALVLEQGSEHPIAVAVIEAARERGIAPMAETRVLAGLGGRGLSAKLADGRTVLLGSSRLMAENGVELAPLAGEAETHSRLGRTLMYLAVEGRLWGLLAVADAPAVGAREAIARLKEQGFRVCMLTGDSRKAAEAVAAAVGVDEVIAEVLPEQKAEAVKRLQAEGARVLMVGDGVNDAVALAQADVGCAIGRGSDIAIESADVVLMRSELMDVARAVELSRATIRNIKQNLFWAFAYNTIGIPIAAGVLYPAFQLLLSPMIAGLAMSASSVCVVTNALRLRGAKLDKGARK